MNGKAKVSLQMMRVLLLSAAFFACWITTLSLPHTNPWWRVCAALIAVAAAWDLMQKYRRRRLRTEQ